MLASRKEFEPGPLIRQASADATQVSGYPDHGGCRSGDHCHCKLIGQTVLNAKIRLRGNGLALDKFNCVPGPLISRALLTHLLAIRLLRLKNTTPLLRSRK